MFLALTFLIICSGVVVGQKISLKGVHLDLSLQDYRLEDIIDGTPDEDHIGYVHKGMINSKLNQLYLDDTVTDEFEYLFKPAFSNSPDAIPLVIRINSLQINEWTAGLTSKVNLASVSLSLFQQVEDDRYILIADRVINDFNLKGVKRNENGERIAQAVTRAFDYLDLHIDTNRPGLTWTELWEYEPFKGLPYPKIKDDLKVFEHYSDFRQNNPFDGADYRLLDPKNNSTLSDNDGNHPRDVWGYTLNGQIYINVGYKFIPLVNRKGALSAEISSGDLRDLSEGVFLFGISKVLGGLSIISSLDRYDMQVDQLTGFLDIKSAYDITERKDRSNFGDRIIIEFAPFGKPDEILIIKMNGESIIQLSKGEFIELPSKFPSGEIQACVDGRCTAILIDNTPMHRIIFKKGIISHEPFTEKEKIRYLRNVDLKYWVLF